MKKLLLENLSENLTVIEKVEFEAVDAVFDALDYAFNTHTCCCCEDEIDNRFINIWQLFLTIAGWNEDDYWTQQHLLQEELKKKREEEKISSETDKTKN